MKELVITIRVPLPDDYLEENEVVAKAKPIITGIREKLDAAGVQGFTIEAGPQEPPKPRAPRQPRSDIGTARKPRAQNGPTMQPTE